VTDWGAIYARFDPEEPVKDPKWRVDRDDNPARMVAPRLNLPFGDKRYLFSGTVGTGKSTELYQLAAQRTGREFVVLVDLWHHFVERVGDPDALNRLQPWQAIFIAGVHLYRAAVENGHRWTSGRADALAEAYALFDDADAPRSRARTRRPSRPLSMRGGACSRRREILRVRGSCWSVCRVSRQMSLGANPRSAVVFGEAVSFQRSAVSLLKGP